MNWKTEAIEKLKQYEAMKTAVCAIPEELKRLELAAGSAGLDKDGSLSNLVCRRELQGNLEQARLWLAAVERALKLLTAEERQILDRFYIRPQRAAVELLAQELYMDVKTVYRKKDQALRRLTIALYGGEN